jgi:hypothetical protein
MAPGRSLDTAFHPPIRLGASRMSLLYCPLPYEILREQFTLCHAHQTVIGDWLPAGQRRTQEELFQIWNGDF